MHQQILEDLILLIPEIFLTIIIHFALLFGVVFSSYSTSALISNKHSRTFVQEPSIGRPFHIIEPIILVSIFCLVLCLVLYAHCPICLGTGFSSSIIYDSTAKLMSILICLSAFACLTLSTQSLIRYGRYEFILIMMLSIIGMLVLTKSYSFLTFFIFVELQSLSFYMLAAMRSRSEASCEAGLKYFILSAFSSVVLLLGISLIYGYTGSHNFADVALIYQTLLNGHMPLFDHTVLNIGMGCILISLLFKLAAVPFHGWVADVYMGSPMAITAFFALTSKIGIVCLLLRFTDIVGGYSGLMLVIAVASGLSLLIGSLNAMRQVKLKRLLAFSGVANVGWFLAALVAGHWQSLILHLFIYLLINTALFSLFIMPVYRKKNIQSFITARPLSSETAITFSTKQVNQSDLDYGANLSAIKYISDLTNVYKTNPVLGLLITICMFNSAGIPPLAGFYSKYLIIQSVALSEQYWLLLAALASAVLGAFYYIRIINTIYFVDSNKAITDSSKSSSSALMYFTQNPFRMMITSTNAYLATTCVYVSILLFFKPDYVILMLL